jgi:HK97 family phage major capsid protein
MTTTEKEALLAKRKGLFEDAKATIELSREQNGGKPTAEAEAESDRMLDEFHAIGKQLEDADAASARSARLAEKLQAAEAGLRQGTGRSIRPAPNGTDQNAATIEFGGRNLSLSAFPDLVRRAQSQYREAFANHLAGIPSATLTLDSASGGGIFAPPQFVGQLIKELDEDFVFRRLATKIPPTTARELEYPRRTTRERRLAKGQTWTASGTSAVLGAMKLQLHPWTGECQINKALMMFSPFDVEGFVRDEIRYDVAATQEQLFMTGSGALEPFGIFTPHDAGLPTSADVTTTLTWDNLVNFRMALRDVYIKSKSVRCLCHRNFQKALMKIRTTDGVPLFQPSLVVGMPDTFLGIPITFSEFAPPGTGASGTYQSGDYVAVIGDFSNYWIFDSMDLPIEQHNLDTRSNLNSYLYRIWFDGGIKMPEAFKRLKIT